MKTIPYFLLLIVILIACDDQKKDTFTSFGQKITDEEAVGLQSLTGMLDESDTAEVKFTATVDEVCQMKGCWMTIKNEYGDPVRVTFKDYAFFVPKDIAGQKTVVSGVATRSILSPETARHYAEDAGEQYDSTRTYVEISVVADGVLVASNQE